MFGTLLIIFNVAPSLFLHFKIVFKEGDVGGHNSVGISKID